MATRQQRIKGMREKTSSAVYAPLVPFGTDGKLVDMLSGLDLEEDLIIGGDHYSTINEVDEEATVITEVFAKRADVEAGTAVNYYKIDTTLSMNEDGDTIIERKLWYVIDTFSEPELMQQKLITISEDGVEVKIEEVLNT